MTEVLAINTAEFVLSAVRPGQYPGGELPEIAFAGRSNVGKSTLINCLVQRKKLVRTSRTPGQTQLINFFRINDALHFVDLPGYGFAKVPEAVRAKWGPMVEAYFAHRRNLKGAVHILDARHAPTPDDLKLWSWLSAQNLPVLPVLTKSDKIPRAKWNVQIDAAAGALGIPPSRIILFSAITQQGRQPLLEQIASLLGYGGRDRRKSYLTAALRFLILLLGYFGKRRQLGLSNPRFFPRSSYFQTYPKQLTLLVEELPELRVMHFLKEMGSEGFDCVSFLKKKCGSKIHASSSFRQPKSAGHTSVIS